MKYKQHSYRLYIGLPGTQVSAIEDLQVTFSVTKKGGGSVNATISITNMSEERLAELDDPDQIVVLEAGYESTGVSILFMGQLKSYSSASKGPDTITKITASSGKDESQVAIDSMNFAEGVDKKTMIDKMLASLAKTVTGKLPLEKGILSGEKLSETISNGFSYSGATLPEIQKIVDDVGYTLSISNGKVNIYPPEEGKGVVGVVLGFGTGLISEPKWERKAATTKRKESYGVSFELLMIPHLEQGDLVELVGGKVKGIFKIEDISFKGDYQGNDWRGKAYATEVKGAYAVKETRNVGLNPAR